MIVIFPIPDCVKLEAPRLVRVYRLFWIKFRINPMGGMQVGSRPKRLARSSFKSHCVPFSDRDLAWFETIFGQNYSMVLIRKDYRLLLFMEINKRSNAGGNND